MLSAAAKQGRQLWHFVPRQKWWPNAPRSKGSQLPPQLSLHGVRWQLDILMPRHLQNFSLL
jgi:hypothetical protein